MAKSYCEQIEAELRRAGVRKWTVEFGKHMKFRFTWNGRNMMFVGPLSPSDDRGLHNSLSDLRRMLGVKLERRKSTRPPKRTTAKPEKPPVLSGTTRPDPWAALRGPPGGV